MGFTLFGFDFSLKERMFGFWIGNVEFFNPEFDRNLLCFYYSECDFLVDILFFRLRRW